MPKYPYLGLLCAVGFILFAIVLAGQLLLVFFPDWQITRMLWLDVTERDIHSALNIVVYLECFAIVPLLLIGLVMLLFGSTRGAWLVLNATIMIVFLDFVVYLIVLRGYENIENQLYFWLAMSPYIIWYLLIWIELGRKRKLLLSSPAGVIPALEKVPRSE
jgi:hypothetical protein